MAPDTNSTPEPDSPARRALSTRTVLVAVLLAVIVTLTGTSLLLVWRRVRQQVTADLSTDLRRSVRAFDIAEAEGFGALRREAALLADLPSLKALLTTNDDRTIQNAAADFWRTSGNELFGLASAGGRVRAVYNASQEDKVVLSRDLGEALLHPGRGYLLSRGHLYRYATHPVYFGTEAAGTLLGTVITGYEVNSSSYLAEMSSSVDANAAFLSDGVMLGSSLPTITADALTKLTVADTPSRSAGQLALNGERYLAAAQNLTWLANAPLQIIFYRSLRPAELESRDITRQLLLLGVALVLLGSLVMVFVARRLTRPLESLANRVNALGEGDGPERPPERIEGTREVRQLALDFQTMRTRIRESNRARLESERLATIGSMATSVSHDLRHHLASIYANAEFLAAPEVTETERMEFFQDIQAAVLDTTEMLESLTIFSRTGQAGRHAPEQMVHLLDRAISQVRMHPAAKKVALRREMPGLDALILADGRQIERALFNLLLNGCQARRPCGRTSTVTASIERDGSSVCVLVHDNGTGIAAEVQSTLFEPFVSSGKQNGTGLGLTLARHIAEDHGGQVDLLRSNFEGTDFELRLPLRSKAMFLSTETL